MEHPSCYTRLTLLGFERIALAHSLLAESYQYTLNNQGYGIYGKTPPQGGILEVGFVEQNPVLLSGSLGEFLIEENGIFIIPPGSSFSVRVLQPGLHRHTSVEFLIRCESETVAAYAAPEGQTLTLPLYIPPAPENAELFGLMRSIVGAHTAQPERSYFAQCADFMQLLSKLCQRLQEDPTGDTVSPGNRRHCNRAKAYVSENLGKRLTVSDVAAAVGVSKNYLTNVFSASEGVPLMEYINRSKLSYMLLLIRRYNYTLAQAGKQVGFTDVNYISRIFKRYYGMTVTDYKHTLENKEDPHV